MADPVLIDITPKDTWVLVAANVQAGHIYKKKDGNYIQTIRDAGNPAPPASLSDQVSIFDETDSAVISSSYPIDVYLRVIGGTGKVRVDLA